VRGAAQVPGPDRRVFAARVNAVTERGICDGLCLLARHARPETRDHEFHPATRADKKPRSIRHHFRLHG
jgi:hypothetical protein